MQDEAMFLTVIQLWAAAAWSDGTLQRNERLLLEHLINSSDVSEPTRHRALEFVARRVDLDMVDVSGLQHDERLGAYRAACRMTIVDGHLDEAERIFLMRLRSLLELDAPTANEIEKMFGTLPRRA
jgi:uncharacterized membrane protein YebE (DUF533 family)